MTYGGLMSPHVACLHFYLVSMLRDTYKSGIQELLFEVILPVRRVSHPGGGATWAFLPERD